MKELYDHIANKLRNRKSRGKDMIRRIVATEEGITVHFVKGFVIPSIDETTYGDKFKMVIMIMDGYLDIYLAFNWCRRTKPKVFEGDIDNPNCFKEASDALAGIGIDCDLTDSQALVAEYEREAWPCDGEDDLAFVHPDYIDPVISAFFTACFRPVAKSKTGGHPPATAQMERSDTTTQETGNLGPPTTRPTEDDHGNTSFETASTAGNHPSSGDDGGTCRDRTPLAGCGEIPSG